MEQKKLKRKGQDKMEKYTFEIKKIIKKQIEIEGKNKQEVLKKLLGFIVKKDKTFCKNILKDDTCYRINLQEINTPKHQILFEETDEINKDVIQFLLNKNNTEIPEENIKIRCKKCRKLHTY